ncbi:MAG: DUF2189 domain-containing protein [Hyphomicrobiaceae bacterium]
MSTATQSTPALKQIAVVDLVDIIGAGIRDFRRAPQFGLVFSGMFALGGWLLIALLWRLNMPYFAYPLAMGFALIAPFAATGFYAVSEHLEQGMPLTWASIMGAIRKAAGGEIRWMAVITGFALIVWMDIAAFLMFAFTSFEVITVDTLKNLLTTPTGWFFAILGNVIGAIIAMAVFSISVVSFPMLYDRKVDFVTAMTTSVRVVTTSPQAMIVWCALIAISMAISIATGLLGLLLTMPIIGHATWHLYRVAVPPAV